MSTPKTIAEYLDQLRQALAQADAAVVQDALYDAEEYLRSELAARPHVGEADLLAEMASTYGQPDEVAAIYLEREVQVSAAFKSALHAKPLALGDRPLPGVAAIAQKSKQRNAVHGFFAVATDPIAYTSLFYMLLSLATGIFYFTWTTVGISLSLGMSVLVIGIPLAIFFMGTVWVLSLVEGRLIETLLGERMPRRPAYQSANRTILQRIGDLLSDIRTWATLLYLLLMLPLGVIYFSIAVTGLALSLSFLFSPLIALFSPNHVNVTVFHWNAVDHPMMLPVLCVLGALGVFLMLHLARGIGRVHAQIAKHLLVRVSE
jgi:uncharacterized membrane protein